MRLRLTKIDEYQLLICLKNGIWGSKSRRFNDWYQSDKFAIIVGKNLTALAEVAGPAFESQEKVWDNGVYPYRIPLRFTHLLSPKERLPVLGEVREALIREWGPRYGWEILHQRVLESPNSDVIVNAITSRPNALQEYQQDLLDRLDEARVRRDTTVRGKPVKTKTRQPRKEPAPALTDDKSPDSKRDSSAHTKAQNELVLLGKITGCSVWIASNDQSRQYAGKPIADNCLKKLPRMGLSDEAAKRISLIDVIWINQNAPVAAFEIETSTSIYSGLLRMSDLLSVVPALNIQIFIIAPKSRQEKILSELGRPTYRRIGLSEYCRYIPSEDLSDLIGKVNGFGGHIQPSILDKIAIPLCQCR